MTTEELVNAIKNHACPGDPPSWVEFRKQILDNLPDDEVVKMFLHHPSLRLKEVPTLEKAKQAALGAFDLEDWVEILRR
jgi:hypothetical protein